MLASGAPEIESTYALPGFDEYLLGYQDRSLQLPKQHAQAVVPGQNGIFNPMLVVNGEVVGTWKRVLTPTSIVVTPTLFVPNRASSKRASRAFEAYGRFYGLPIELTKG